MAFPMELVIISDPSQLDIQIIVVEKRCTENSLLESFSVDLEQLSSIELGKRKIFYRNGKKQGLCVFSYETKEQFIECLLSLFRIKNLHAIAIMADIVDTYSESINEFMVIHEDITFVKLVSEKFLRSKLKEYSDMLNVISPLEIKSQPEDNPEKRIVKQKIETAKEMDEDLFERLRRWRLQVAREMDVPAFIIFPNTTLQNLSAVKPKTIEELLSVRGIGKTKAEQYGDTLLSIINSNSSDIRCKMAKIHQD